MTKMIQNIANARVNLVVGGTSASATTGLSRYARSLYEALVEQELAVSVTGTKGPSLSASLRRIVRGRGFDLDSFFTTYPLGLATKAAKDVIVHLTSQNQASAVAFKAPARLVITVHDVITSLYRHDRELTGYMKAYDKVFDDLIVRGLKKAALLLADSHHTRQDLMQLTGLPAERIEVVPIGLDHANFQQRSVPDEFYNRYGLQPGTPYVLYVGSEDPRKNLRRLIEAFAGLLVRMPQVRLLKVGGARFQAEREQLLRLIEQHNLKNKILFFDQVNEADLATFYNLAEVFAFPSLYEGFGLPPLEAMACGTPVVCSNRSSLPEVVGQAACLFDPYDIEAISTTLEQVLGDEVLKTRLQKMGLQRAAEFSWQKTALQTLAAYDRVLQQVV